MSNVEKLTRPTVIKCGPGAGVRLRLAADERHHRGHPINRDYDLPQFTAGGKALTDQKAMRQGLVKTTAEHVADLLARYPGEELLGYVGNGNLLANYRFVGWLAGKLYHLKDEPVFHRHYTAIVGKKDGSVSVDEVYFVRENGSTGVLRKADHTVEEITPELDFVSTGQPLVRDGEAVPLSQIAEQWYDTRHLVLPLVLRINGATSFLPNAQLQEGLLRKALVQPVRVRLEGNPDAETTLPLTTPGWLRMAEEQPEALERVACFLRKHELVAEGEKLSDPAVLLRTAKRIERQFYDGLRAAGYQLVDVSRPLQEGEARFINGHLEIFFRKAVYPHNIFVRWPEGSFGFVVFPGLSGRSGVTLPNAQEFLTGQLKVQDALLVDNGGDVRLWYRGQYLVPSSEGREEIRSILAIAAPKGKWMGDAVTVF